MNFGGSFGPLAPSAKTLQSHNGQNPSFIKFTADKGKGVPSADTIGSGSDAKTTFGGCDNFVPGRPCLKDIKKYDPTSGTLLNSAPWGTVGWRQLPWRERAIMSTHCSRGFTLIEVMIVVVIVSILSALYVTLRTWNTYEGGRGRRRGAAMLRMAQYQERNFSDRGTYVCDDNLTGNPWTSLSYSGPEANKKYTITVVETDEDVGTPPCLAYEIRATVEAPFSDAVCSPLTLTSQGTKGAAGDVATCWR